MPSGHTRIMTKKFYNIGPRMFGFKHPEVQKGTVVGEDYLS